MTSKYDPHEREFSGVFDQNEDVNPLSEYNQAYLAYCTSDGHMGDIGSSDEIPKYQFRGRRVVRALVEDINS